MTAAQAYSWIVSNVGPTVPKRDQVDSLIVAEVNSRGTQGRYIYRETDNPLINDTKVERSFVQYTQMVSIVVYKWL
ncbi:hypothetical protein A4D02_17910 [Niastella koreensis]|uniref:Uncharacterized protein n=1 Tax=Niastella koreensis TaxID=354356 RepID=A0ABX3NLY7_9BACT|nr:hypothetical protein [Niastella koreensis]OQP39202.1 hypothetical protein A4D02_17910 [Niastella koreensis]